MTLWGWVLCGYVLLVTIPLVVIDFRVHRLPNWLVVPGIALALVCLGAQWWVTGQFPLVAALSGLAYGVGMLVLAVLGGMGMGDVKLALVLGTAAGMFGVSAALANAALAFVLGGVAALGVLLWQRIRKSRRSLSRTHRPRTHIAFGPFMLAGFWTVVTAQVIQALGVH